MKPAFVPEFITTQFERQQYDGSFEGATVFLDISGFTPLTAKLMAHGRSGAEVISDTLNAMLSPMLDSVHRLGGFVAGFAGDAFLAVFPEHTTQAPHADAAGVAGGGNLTALQRATLAATSCRGVIAREHIRKTGFGEFALDASLGIGCGLINWGIVGDEHTRLSWYFRGPGTDAAFSQQKKAAPGEIRISSENAATLSALSSERFRVTVVPAKPESAAEPGQTAEAKPADGSEPSHIVRSVSVADAPAAPVEPTGQPEQAAHSEQTAQPRPETRRRFRTVDDLPEDGAGEFREVTSVFVSAEVQPEHDDISSAVTAVLRACERVRGYFDVLDFSDKGCMMLILFGAPRASGSETRRAAAFAETVLESLQERARVGIARGTVYTGYVGGRSRGTYTAIGESVNLAARISTAVESGSAYLDADTAQHLESGSIEPGAVNVKLKGYSEPLTLTRLLPEGEQRRSKARSDTRRAEHFVGRDDDVAIVRSRLSAKSAAVPNRTALREDTRAADPDNGPEGVEAGLSYLEITGESGIGKTKLTEHAVAELRAYGTIPDDAPIVTLRADPVLSRSLNLFSDLFPQIESALGLGEEQTGTLESRTSKLVDAVRGQDPEAGRHLHDYRAAIPALTGAHGEPEYESQEPRRRFEMMIQAAIGGLWAISKIVPRIVVLEDMYAVDDDSLQALERAIFALASEPLTIVALSRESAVSAGLLRMPDAVRYESLALSALPSSAMQELATRVIGSTASPILAEFIMGRVGGNPFYATEMLRYLAESGGLSAGPNGYEPAAQEKQVPRTVLEVLTERFDSLPNHIRSAAEIAAVIGEEFAPELIVSVLNDDEAKRTLLDGQNHGLWTRSSTGSYRFAQPLIREAIVSMQLDRRRTDIHRRVLEALEHEHANDPRYAAELAYHAEHAAAGERALHYRWKAFEYARDNFKNTNAKEFLRGFILQSPSPSQRLAAYLELAALLEMTGDWEQAADSLTYALGLARLAKLPQEAVPSLNSLCRIYQRMGRTRDAVAAGMDAVEEAQRHADTPGLAEAHTALARAYWSLGRLDTAETHAKQATKLASTVEDRRTEGLACYYHGVILRDRNAFDAALQLYRRSEELLSEYGDSQLSTFPVYDMALLLQYEGKLEDAERYFNRVLRVYEDTGYRSGASAAVLNLGVIADRKGEFETAIERFTEARRIAESIGEQLAIAYTLFSIGATYYKMRENRKALSYLRDSLRLTRSLGAHGYYAYPLSYLAALHARVGDLDRVIALAHYHMQAVKQTGSDPENGLALLSLARALTTGGPGSKLAAKKLHEIGEHYEVEIESPRAVFEKALTIAAEARYVNTLIPAHYHLARYLQRAADAATAAEHGSPAVLKREACGHLREAYKQAKKAQWHRFVRMLEDRLGTEIFADS